MTWNPKRHPLRGGLLVVGGQCSKVGKTALIVDVIRATPDLCWTAVKITPYARSGCPVNGPTCGCHADEHTFAMREDQNQEGTADTSRFLAAGARRAIWLETKQGRLADALGLLGSTLEGSEPADSLVIESNAVAEFWGPDLFLIVLDPRERDFKQTAKQALPLADTLVLRSPVSHPQPDFPPRIAAEVHQKPTILQVPGQPLPFELQRIVQQRIGRARHTRRAAPR